MASEQAEREFTTGNIFRRLIGSMAPVLGALILQTMYGAVDILVVGWFGSRAGISAVSAGSSLINAAVFVLCGLATSVTVLMRRCIGEGDRRRLGRLIGGAVAVFTAAAAVLTAVFAAFAPSLVSLLQVPQEAAAQTVLYVRICGGGIAFIIGCNLTGSIFRGMGNGKLPLLFAGIACAANIFLDLLFVAVLRRDVAGAAFATVIAQACSFILSLLACRRTGRPFELTRSDLVLSGEVKRFLILGLPIAFQELLTQISFLCMIAFVNGMGEGAAGLASSCGYGIANRAAALVMLVPSALMQSTSAFIAQNVGAGKERRAQKVMGCGMLFGCAVGILMTAAAFFGGQQIAALFTDSVSYRIKAAEYLQGYSLEAIVTSILFSFVGYYSGHNQTLFVILQGMAQSFLVRLPLAYAASLMAPDSLVYIGASAPAATTIGIVINLLFFLCYSRRELKKTGELLKL